MKQRLPLVLALLLPGCHAPPGAEPNAWVLDEGTPIASLGAPDHPYVVLILDPRDTFTCYGTLAEWLEWRRAHPDQFHLVFTRRPSPPERRRLAAVRLPLRGFLSTPPPASTPAELVVSRGAVVYSRTGVTTAEASGLIPSLREGSLLAFASALPSPPSPVGERR